jgi:dTDP-4-dehydrorhamnose 3,5-epimerase
MARICSTCSVRVESDVRRIDTRLPGVAVLEPRVFADHRGFFMETFNRRTMAELGIEVDWVQDNHSRSARGVLRGLHYQVRQPQAKLVRVTLGRVWDVVVDIRRGSSTFGEWEGFELDADSKHMLFAPAGYAHGFLVLSEVAEFQYKCSDFYAPEHERGLAWDDPDLAIAWPLDGVEPILSERDRTWPRLADVPASDLPETV